MALVNAAVQAKYLKLTYYTLASIEFHAEKKEQSKAAKDKNCWTQNIWKGVPLWHSKIFTHENKAHLWSSKLSMSPAIRCTATSSADLRRDGGVRLLEGYFIPWYYREEKHAHLHTALEFKLVSDISELLKGAYSNAEGTWSSVQEP